MVRLSEIDEEYSGIRGDLADLSTVQVNLSKPDPAIAILQAQTSQLQNLQQRYAIKAIAEAKFSNLSSSMSSLTQTVSNIGAVLDNANITNLATVSQLAVTVQNFNGAISNNSQGIMSLNASINVLKTNVTTQATQYSQVVTNLSVLNANVAGLNYSVTANQNGLTTVQAATVANSAAINTVNATVATLPKKVGNIRNVTCAQKAPNAFTAADFVDGCIMIPATMPNLCPNGYNTIVFPSSTLIAPYLSTTGSTIVETYFWNWYSCPTFVTVSGSAGYDSYNANMTVPSYSTMMFRILRAQDGGSGTRWSISNQ